MLFRFRLTGVIREEESGEPLAGLVVRAWDKDLVFDDHLGDTSTDAAGRFELTFTDEAFRKLYEERPDVYLMIYDRDGEREIHSTKEAVRENAGEEEHFEIRVPRRKLGPGGS